MEENNEQVIDNTQQTDAPEEPQTLEDKIILLRNKWTTDIKNLNEDMKNLPSLDSLLNVIYSKRQDAVDAYYGTFTTLKKQLRDYKVKYADIYNKLTLGANGIRYSNQSALSTQCEAQLNHEQEIIDELKTFVDFMGETIKTLDGLIYAVSSKIKIHEILHGLKF